MIEKYRNKKLMSDHKVENQFNKKPNYTTLMRIWIYNIDLNGKGKIYRWN